MTNITNINTSKIFLQRIIFLAIKSFFKKTLSNNFDIRRFGRNQPSPIRYWLQRFKNLVWFLTYYKSLYKAYSYLANVESKKLFFNLILYRINGYKKVEIQAEFKNNEKIHLSKPLFKEKVSKTLISHKGFDHNLMRYHYSYKGHKFVVD